MNAVLNMSEQNCGFFVNDNSHQFYKNCSGFSHSKGTVMQCTFLESKNIGIFRDINFLMPDYELPQIKRVKLLKLFVAKTLLGFRFLMFPHRNGFSFLKSQIRKQVTEGKLCMFKYKNF